MLHILFILFLQYLIKSFYYFYSQVTKPQLGETIPGHVHCTIEVDISRFSGQILEEWESLRDHDVIFMVCIEEPQSEAADTLNEFEK
jgi:hypothetical protein